MYDPLNKYYKSRTGAVCAGREITFRIKGNFGSVFLVYVKDGEDNPVRVEMGRIPGGYECRAVFERGLYGYYFDLGSGNYLGRGRNFKCVISDNPVPYQLTAYTESFKVPDWLKGGIIYQIFPDRFNSSGKHLKPMHGKTFHADKKENPVFMPNMYGNVLNNDFFGGDLEGITAKLDYIKSLGVTAIYLNPIFAAYSNHRYDTADYMSIDPLLGDENDLKNLIAEAGKRSIKIILDGVFNHTGDDSIYFDKYGTYGGKGAYSDINSPYIGWYNFIMYPEIYESWWGIQTLPSTNKRDSGFIEFITGKDGVISHYTKLGIGGWRLDVVDELPAPFVRKIRQAVKDSDTEALIIGEVWENASDKISYGVRREYFQGYELDSVMNYPLKNAILGFVNHAEAEHLSVTIKEQIDDYPDFVLDSAMNVLSTHDTARLLSAVSDFDAVGKSKAELAEVSCRGKGFVAALKRLKAATLLQFTLRGVPAIYYGDEVGMEGFCDPLNRRFFPWDNIDEEIREWYVNLGEIRRSSAVFSDGDYREIYASEGMIVFVREKAGEQYLIAVNAGKKERRLEFTGKLTNLIDCKTYDGEIKFTEFDMGIFVCES